jgi:hypothetical protein
MTRPHNIEANLKSIREVVDTNVVGCDIESVVEQGKKLASIMGLSAECMAAAQRHLQEARLKAIKELGNQNYQPSILLKMADGQCGIELAIYEYADRLNASITHQLDYYRTVISLHKSEMENSMKQ